MSHDEPNKIIYSMMGVSKHYNHQPVIKDISLSYFYGAKIGVIGLNASGKSSLLRIMAGVDQDFEGETHLAPGYSVGYLEQEPELDQAKTVRDVVAEGAQEAFDLLQEFEEINAKFAEPMDDQAMDKLINRQAEVQSKLDAVNAWDIESRLDMAMEALRCPPGDTQVANISGGEKRRVALCRLLIRQPDILLLDEPTNHLDAETVAWLEHHLQAYPGTVIAVTHDRYFLNNVAGWILELDRGVGVPWKGNYASWLEQKKTKMQQEKRVDKKWRTTLARELEWLHMSPEDRHKHNQERIVKYSDLLSAADTQSEDLQIVIPPGPRLGDVVVEADQVRKAFGDILLMDGMSFTVPPGAIVGIIGPNGAGKTTLFRMLTGNEEPDDGTLRLGQSVKLAYVEQSREKLDPQQTVWEAISGGKDTIRLGDREVNSRAYVARFNITGAEQQRKVGELSGGVRNRVHLAMMVKEGANLLLLDEPTNDLDVNTMRALEDALQSFAGSAMIISHDRWFLDRVATHILAFEGESQVVWFDGNFSEYEEDKKRRLGQDALQPQRIKYRKLTR
ncbi:energy-dependent translational throttle protein EttA [Desulfovermiculus halophilus]|jgi:ATP-binding cassette ChvD family protein|uniref:energy-dependent translational throttle protein EttA n=1 Tax=Desulfovermiculus halophilus TaxID=339722 RepID=UPI0004830BA1|nr:energy-dependent translational throttle protein EttA [Desulfovermiculus halophilus]